MPPSELFVTCATQLYHVTGNTDKAKEILKQQFKSMKEEADRNVNYEPNLNLVNLISEVYMGLKKWQKAADIIAWAQHQYECLVTYSSLHSRFEPLFCHTVGGVLYHCSPFSSPLTLESVS